MLFDNTEFNPMFNIFDNKDYTKCLDDVSLPVMVFELPKTVYLGKDSNARGCRNTSIVSWGPKLGTSTM